MLKPFHLLSALTEGVKINSMRREERGGRCFLIKTRRISAMPILLGADAFFQLAKAPLRPILPTEQWQNWEVECFLALHGPEGFAASVHGDRAVAAEELPGTNLTEFLDGGRLVPEMAAAAARELRRVHAWQASYFEGGWSHGDAHAGNFVIEARDGEWRARVIDFELRHLARLPVEERQLDDLVGFLLDLVGRIEAAQWLPCSEAFLSAYAAPSLVARLPERLLPGGAAPYGQMWRRVQTGFLSRAEYERRVGLLLSSPVFHRLDEPCAKAPQPHSFIPAFGSPQPSELVAKTHSATGMPPSRCS